MRDRSQPSRFLPRLLLLTATLAAGTSIWFLLGEPESVIAEEGPAGSAFTESTLAVVAGEAITEEEIMALAADDLRELEQRRQELIRELVEVRIRERLIDLAARAEGLSREEYLAAEIGQNNLGGELRHDPAYEALVARLAVSYGVEVRLESTAGSAPGL